jgi:hypothetical protein
MSKMYAGKRSDAKADLLDKGLKAAKEEAAAAEVAVVNPRRAACIKATLVRLDSLSSLPSRSMPIIFAEKNASITGLATTNMHKVYAT